MDVWNPHDSLPPHTPRETLHELGDFVRWLVHGPGHEQPATPMQKAARRVSEELAVGASVVGHGAAAGPLLRGAGAPWQRGTPSAKP
jgi:hypothetical protein